MFDTFTKKCTRNYTAAYAIGRVQRGIGGPDPPPPLKITKNIGSLTGPDPLKNHKATEPAFNVRPLSARQRNINAMAFRWWPMMAHVKRYLHQLKQNKKKRYQIWTPSDKTF